MNDFEKYLLSCADAPNLVIYGTGLAAQFVYEGLNKLGINVNCFCEQKQNNRGQYLGLPVKTESDIPKNSRCLICANPDYKIEKRLEKYQIQDWKYIDPVICREFAYNENYFYGILSMIDMHKEKIDEVRKCLADEQSRHVLDVILEHRQNPNIDTTYGIYTEQYFGNDLIDEVDEYNFVDCGAYNGDTLKRFIKHLKNPGAYFQNHTYHAFEADKNNIREIERYCQRNEIENVILHQSAVWNGNENKLYFEVDNNEVAVGGKVCLEKKSKLISVKAECLDDVLVGQHIDMIAMDIEGAESEALKGATCIIREQAPVLAISVYHKLEHLWEIPMQIKAYNSDYKIYLRHHRWNVADTVCYAIK